MHTFRRGATLLGSLSIVGLALSGCHQTPASSDGASPPGGAAAVATVNGEAITQPQFFSALQSYIPGQNAQPQSAGNAVLAQLINSLISEQYAKQQGVPVTESEVDAQYNDYKLAQEAQSVKTFEEQLAEAGLTPGDFKDIRLRPDLAQFNLLTKGVAPPTDAEIQDYYTKNQAQFTKPNRAKLRVIVLGSQADAKKVADQIQSGQAFDTFLSQSLNKNFENGQFPQWVNTDNARPEYAALVKGINATAEGKTTAPISLNGAWWLIQVQEKRKKEIVPLDQVKDIARFKLLQQKVQADPGKYFALQQQVRQAATQAKITVADKRYQPLVKQITEPRPAMPPLGAMPSTPTTGRPAPKATR